MDHQIQYPGNMAEGTLMPQNDAVKLTPELIDSFEAYMKNKGMDQGSIKSYRQAVEMLYQWLPEEKVMDRDTLRQWSENLQKESYAVRTVNRFLSVGNTLADFLGHREFQIKTLMVDADEVLPELTRNEYLRMLQTAKALKNERVYFLIKVFANVDLPVQQASKLTVEAAEEGKLVIDRGGGREIIRLPKCLCQELLSYAKRSGITTGPLFLTRQKKPMRRTQISDSIRRMCLEAKIPEGKGNPRCLRKLYKETMRSIYANMDFLFAKAYEQILDQEQLIYGWEESI